MVKGFRVDKYSCQREKEGEQAESGTASARRIRLYSRARIRIAIGTFLAPKKTDSPRMGHFGYAQGGYHAGPSGAGSPRVLYAITE